MKINKQTKIAVLIKENEKTIEAIASINPHFNKLKNPILRKVLAPRVTIEDAARIGKCEVAVFFKKLADIGFDIENNPKLKEEKMENSQNLAILNAIKSGRLTTLDVRPSLAKGEDPFKTIMGEIEKLQEGYALEIINTFEPIPIIKILNQKGFLSLVKKEEDVIYTYFLKHEEEQEEKLNSELTFKVSLDELETQKKKYANACVEIDVRDLEMPLPMVTVLNELEKLQENEALFVNHKKIPQYLLPEVAARNFKTWIAEIDNENVKLLIHK